MLRPASPTDCYALRYGPEPDVLRLCWQRGPTLAELQQAYEQTRTAAVQLLAPRWLVDSRQRTLPPPPEQSQWLHREFLPGLYAYLPEPLRLACLMTPEQLAGVHQDPRRTAQAQHLTAPEQPFWLAFFDDEAAALRWLQA